MKRCQKCSRTFPDENQKFCTFDGGLLMADQPTFDPNRTILAPQMTSLPPAAPTAPPPPAVPVPPPAAPKASAPARDMSETIVAYRPGSAPEAPSEPLTSPSGSQTAPDLTPPVSTPAAQTSRDLVAPTPPSSEAQTSSELTLPHSVAPTSRELPPLPPVPAASPAPPPAAPVAPPPPPVSAAPPTPPPIAQSSTPTPAEHQAPTVILPQPPAPATEPVKPAIEPVKPAEQAKPPTEQIKPATQQAKPAKKRSLVPVIIGILVVLLLGIVGLGVAGYVFQDKIREFVTPYLGSKGSPTPTPANENANSSTNENANTNSNSANTNSSTNSNNETKNEPPAFVPPADAIQFTNSKDNLDGDLAEHYVGFSFYYPKTWTKDPKAGVRGATTFAKVDRQFSDSTGDFIQERALFNWYPSNGNYEADVADFPQHAKKVTDQLAKGLPNYEEVSRGETTVNVYKGYEVRFKGEFKNGNKSLPYWGRVIFLPPGTANEKAGVALVMLATSYAPGVTSAEDVGAKGELAMILDSFRFAPKP